MTQRHYIFAAAAAAVALALPASASAVTTTVKVGTSMTPSFSRATSNYVASCSSSGTKVAITADKNVTGQVGSAKAKAGSQSTTLRLKAGQRTIVKLTDTAGTTAHSIRCLPTDFPKLAATGRLPESIPLLAINDISARSDAYAGSANSYAVIVDRNGTPIWWHKEGSSLVNFFATADAKLGFGRSGGALHIRNLSNVTLQTVPTNADTDAHDAVPAGDGNWYLGVHTSRKNIDLTPIGDRANVTALDSTLVKVGPDGTRLWTWNSADHIALGETLMTQVQTIASGERLVDIAHVNSFEPDGQGGIIASFRENSAVYRINLADGSIDWKLGGTQTDKSLSVLGDPGIGDGLHLLGQHDARLQPDGTLTLFDNGSPVAVSGGRYNRHARALRFAINPVARTATVVETITDPGIGSAICCGSARKMSDGSWVIGWGNTPHMRAYNSSGTNIFTLKYLLSTRFTYRATPITTISESDLVNGMDAVK